MRGNGGANSRGEAAPGLPRYAQVANDLMERIAAGEYPIGSLLPKELDLSAEYRISRHTMREALRRLDEAGLVSRRRRAGTEVLAAVPAASYRQPINSIDDLLQYGEATEIRVRRKTRVKCNAALARMLGCEKGREWLCVETIRTRPGDPRPICHTTVYLNAELDGIDARVGALAGPISAMIETIYGLRITEIEQSIRAVSLGTAGAKRLRVDPGSPALQAIRRYYDATKRLVELAIAVHPGERFVYVTRLRRQ
ncbi:MAG: GntR family transcriptional regulator [Casimicrobiaceae bacterium]